MMLDEKIRERSGTNGLSYATLRYDNSIWICTSINQAGVVELICRNNSEQHCIAPSTHVEVLSWPEKMTPRQDAASRPRGTTGEDIERAARNALDIRQLAKRFGPLEDPIEQAIAMAQDPVKKTSTIRIGCSAAERAAITNAAKSSESRSHWCRKILLQEVERTR